MFLCFLSALTALGTAAVGLVHHRSDLVRVQPALVHSVATVLLLLLLLGRSSGGRSSSLRAHRGQQRGRKQTERRISGEQLVAGFGWD